MAETCRNGFLFMDKYNLSVINSFLCTVTWTVFLPEFVKFAELFSLRRDLKVICNSLGRGTNLPLVSRVGVCHL